MGLFNMNGGWDDIYIYIFAFVHREKQSYETSYSWTVPCPWKVLRKPPNPTQLRARPSGTNPGNALKTLSVLFSIQTSLAVKSPHLSLTEATKKVDTLWRLAIV